MDRQMPRVKNGRYLVIQTGKQGNGEGGNIANSDFWIAPLKELLGSATHPATH